MLRKKKRSFLIESVISMSRGRSYTIVRSKLDMDMDPMNVYLHVWNSFGL